MTGQRHSRWGWLAVIVAVAVLGGGAVLPARAEAQTATDPVLGVVSEISWGTSRTNVDRAVALMREAGVRWARVNISWSGGEPQAKGSYNDGWLSEIDYAVGAARAAGIEVLMPIADGVPYWASADPLKTVVDGTKRWNKMWRPTSMADYGDFVRYVTARYSPMGVHAFEIWNEPNHPRFWPSGPNPAEYVEMLRAGRAAVKAVAPGATVVMGGLSKNDADYLAGVYRAGGGPLFDVAAVHPYVGGASPWACWNDATGRPALDAFCSLRNVRDVMVANGDSGKALWLTEFGWSTSTGDYSVTEAKQAEYLVGAVRELRTNYPYVTHALWFMSRDWSDDRSNWDGNTGLLRRDFSQKPSYAAFKEMAGSTGDTTTTTTTTAPSTTTTAPSSTTTTAPSTTTTTTAAPTKEKKVRRMRVAGANRVLTAVALSQQAITSGETVVLARADAYADALAAAPLAARHGTSVLLTPSGHLPESVMTELARLRATRVILIGGTSAISPTVELALRGRGLVDVRRIAGSNRYDTARLIAQELGGQAVIITEGANRDPKRGWPDAVAAASFAAATGRPILLVESTMLPPETASALRELGAKSATVIGGPAAVSDDVVAQLSGQQVTRIAGHDRFDTSVRVAELGRALGLSGPSAWVATGLDWPDALAAGAAVAAGRSVLVLVDGRDVARSAASSRWMSTQASLLDELVIVGGSASVSDSVEQALHDQLD